MVVIDMTFEIPFEIIMAVVAGILVAVSRYFQVLANGKAAENAQLIVDKQLHQEALLDLARIGAKAYVLNADGNFTQEEYNVLMEEIKPMLLKYGDKFGFKVEIETILEHYKPKGE